MMRALLPLAALAATLASPASAATLDARAMLVSSTPARDAELETAPEVIALSFAEPARVISVTVRLPDDSEVEAEPEAPAGKERQSHVRYRLPGPLVQPGSYTISYLLTSKSFKSLNGFIDFRIAGEAAADPAPAPENQENDE